VTPSLLEIGCYYLLGWALLNLGCRSAAIVYGAADLIDGGMHRSSDDGAPVGANLGGIIRRLPPVNVAVIALVVVLAILTADTGYWMYQRFWHPDLRVTAIDVGQGTASLVEIPGGHTMLIDGGGFSDNTVFDVGARVIAPFLWCKKIRTVDELILSHPNSDHLNGLIYVAGHFHVRKIWTNGQGQETLGYAHFMDVIRRKNIPRPPFVAVGHKRRMNGVEVDFLYPPSDFLARKKFEKWRTANNNSLVVRVSLGDVAFLFPGDIMAAAEKELVRLSGRQLASTVLMAPHHGSRSSSSAVFVDTVNPAVVIFSAGRKGRYRFPHPAVVKRYEKRNCRIYCTAQNGAVQLSTDGQRLTIRPFGVK
jgi:competence protein ComEC